MKKITYCIALAISSHAFSQVIIGKGKTSITNTSVSLEFGDTEKKGIVLPYVKQSDISAAEDGTLIMDPSDKQIKLLKNGRWTSITGGAYTNNAIETSIQDAKTDLANAKVSIGTPTSVSGILVLEDTDKAMILPRVSEPHKFIKNPAAGMMVYDTKNKQLAVFNGTQWSFWKP